MPSDRPCRAAVVAPLLASALSLLVASCASDEQPTAEQGGFSWQLPAGFPMPVVPADNPMSEHKVELGRHLFYDTRLSQNGDTACGTCHEQAYAFTDRRARAVGTAGAEGFRGAMSIANVAYASRLTWAHPLLDRLEDQALIPMFGEDPVEMGLAGREAQLLGMLSTDTAYQALFSAAFPGDSNPYSLLRVSQAIACFERTLLSGGSPYDRYIQGDTSAMSASAVRGMELFYSERTECFHCHGGFNFSDSSRHEGASEEIAFHNTGLYNLDGQGAYPADDAGLSKITGDIKDMGRFKAPTLRNVAVTAPYMHDGSIETLRDVIAHYSAGGRTVAAGEHAGVGSESPLKSEFVPGFIVTEDETADLIEFFESLTDPGFLNDPRFADPFAR